MALLKAGHPYNPNYALPQNVIDEPLGRGTFNGQYIPRGTIDTMVPEQFQGLGSLSSDVGNTLSQHTLKGTTLGDDVETHDHRRKAGGGPPGFPGDPIAEYGVQSASVLLRAVANVPIDHRKPLLKEMLDHIDPSLWDRVASKATELKKSKGYNAQTALQKALSVCMASGLLNELDAYGKGKKKIDVRSHMGLGLYGVGSVGAYQEALGFSFSSITSAIGSAAKAVGGAVSTAAKATYNVGKTALNTVGGLACKASGIASSVPPVTPATAGVAAGASLVKGICGSGGSKPAAPPPPPPSGGGFLDGGGIMSAKVAGVPLPLIIAGGGVALFLMLRRKPSAA